MTSTEATQPGDSVSNSGTSATAETKLPPLSGPHYRVYNRMAEHMNYFHEHFRGTWKQMYSAASAGVRPKGLSTAGFVRMAEQFCQQLTFHHTIEEQHVFPVLAVKMPAFRAELDLLTHHSLIHDGIVRFETYLSGCRSGERELRLEEVKAIMDSFGDVLWTHLDAEVAELGAENMRKYWNLEEMQRMPM